ncbi:hypothetical protein KJ865_11555, partial [Myxococcota bacterium]|nr:hypothetical protein [Myxococcota bacterium]
SSRLILTPSGLATLKSLKNLRRLSFDQQVFDEARAPNDGPAPHPDIIGFLKRFPLLEGVRLEGRAAIRENIEPLSSFAALKRLELFNVTDSTILPAVSRLTHLEALVIDAFSEPCAFMTPRFTPGDMARLGALTRLRSLRLTDVDAWTGQATLNIEPAPGAMKFLSQLTHLEDLRLKGDIEDALRAIPRPGHLRTLTVPDLGLRRDATLNFFKKASGLQQLIIGSQIFREFGGATCDEESRSFKACKAKQHRETERFNKHLASFFSTIRNVPSLHIWGRILPETLRHIADFRALRVSLNLDKVGKLSLSDLFHRFPVVEQLTLTAHGENVQLEPPKKWPRSFRRLDIDCTALHGAPGRPSLLSSTRDLHLRLFAPMRRETGVFYLVYASWPPWLSIGSTALKRLNGALDHPSTADSDRDVSCIPEELPSGVRRGQASFTEGKFGEGQWIEWGSGHRQYWPIFEASSLPQVVYTQLSSGITHFDGPVLTREALKALLKNTHLVSLKARKGKLASSASLKRAARLEALRLGGTVSLQHLAPMGKLNTLTAGKINAAPGAPPLPSLRRITILDGVKSAKDLHWLNALPSLRVLHLRNTRATDPMLKVIAARSKLTELVIESPAWNGPPDRHEESRSPQKTNSALTNAGLTALSSMRTLRVLHLEGDAIGLSGIRVLPPSLSSLTILGRGIGEDTIAHLATLPLKHLGFNAFPVSNTSLLRISRMGTLRSLRIWYKPDDRRWYKIFAKVEHLTLDMNAFELNAVPDRAGPLGRLKTFAFNKHVPAQIPMCHPNDNKILALLTKLRKRGVRVLTPGAP